MPEQSTTAPETIPVLPVLHCANCGRGVGAAAAIGLVSIVCARCRAWTLFLDGEAVLVQRRRVQGYADLRSTNEVKGAPTVEEIVDLVEQRWETFAKTRA